MKFFKLFFSRFLIISVAIILQVVVFAVVTFYLSESFAWINVVISVLGVLLFLIIINKDRPASFKLPWVAVVLFVPILGIFLYLAFGNLNLSKKQRKMIVSESKDLRNFCKQNEQTIYELREENLQAYGQARYIEKTSCLPTYNNCYSEYLATGEEFFEKLVFELSNAKKYIFMEYFIVEKGYMWNTIYEILKQKAHEGVEVHFMYDDVGSISKVPNDFLFDLRNDGIYATKFNPFKPFVSVFHNNRDHRKITVIDGEVGFIGGANLADEYINITNPFGKWKDNAILLKGKCVDSLIQMFLQLYNTNSLKKLKIEDYLIEEHQIYDCQGYLAPYGDGPAPVYPDFIGESVYLNMINQSEKYLYIYTPYLIVDYEFITALVNASKRGVDVHIVTPRVPDKKIIKIMTKSNYYRLIKEGVKIHEYEPGFIHAKMFVCDDKYASIGTINLDYRSLVHHFECGVWCYNTSCIYDMKNDFERLLKEESIDIDLKKAKLNFGERIIKDVLRLIAPLM